jgi:cobalamin-dependent methionine synthase I
VAEEPESADAGRGEEPNPAALDAEFCPKLAVAPPAPAEIYRYLGYPRNATPAPRVADEISEIVADALDCLHPRGAYTIYPVNNQSEDALQLGTVTISGKIAEFLGQASRVAVFVVTAGEEISQRAKAANRSGNALAAWVMDALGSWAAESTADALMLRLRPQLRAEEELTLRYSPGYCGMEIGEQRNLFQLMQRASAGVSLLPSMLMYPLKSVSGLVGLAPRAVVRQHRSPCEICARTGCHMRR